MPALRHHADPDAELIAAEAALDRALKELHRLDRAWKTGATPKERYYAGLEVEAALEGIAELQHEIASTKARTPAGAAVKLRRLAAMLRDDQALLLLNDALTAIEANSGSASGQRRTPSGRDIRRHAVPRPQP